MVESFWKEASAPESVEMTREVQDARERVLFSEFGWDPEAFRSSVNETVYQECLETQAEILAGEIERYGDTSLYRFSWETFSDEGPNCYAFALQCLRNPATGEAFAVRPMPGVFAHGDSAELEGKMQDVLNNGSPEEQKSFFSGLIREDAEALGMEMKEVGKDYVPQKGEWVIALAATNGSTYPSGLDGDFHFYRKSDGGQFWMHKPGVNPVEDTDMSGKKILDPAECDRGIYDNFLGYYAIKGKEEV